MKLKTMMLLAATGGALAWCVPGAADDGRQPVTKWKLKADIVEASTDAKFCPCYDTAANDRNSHHCRFVAVMRIREGAFGDVKLDGMTIGLAGDLGRDLTGVGLSTLVVFTEPAATKEQKEAVEKVLRGLYPMTWTKKVMRSGNIDFQADADGAKALVGDMGSLGLAVTKDEKGTPVVKKGLAWWNARVLDGFTQATGSVTFKGEGLNFAQGTCSGFKASIEAEGDAAGHP